MRKRIEINLPVGPIAFPGVCLAPLLLHGGPKIFVVSAPLSAFTPQFHGSLITNNKRGSICKSLIPENDSLLFLFGFFVLLTAIDKQPRRWNDD